MFAGIAHRTLCYMPKAALESARKQMWQVRRIQLYLIDSITSKINGTWGRHSKCLYFYYAGACRDFIKPRSIFVDSQFRKWVAGVNEQFSKKCCFPGVYFFALLFLFFFSFHHISVKCWNFCSFHRISVNGESKVLINYITNKDPGSISWCMPLTL